MLNDLRRINPYCFYAVREQCSKHDIFTDLICVKIILPNTTAVNISETLKCKNAPMVLAYKPSDHSYDIE